MKRFKHNLSKTKLLSCNEGELIPVSVTEVLPGDTIQQSTSMLIRVSPLLAPVMHPVTVRVHHWFVPHRLVWDEWEDFITGGPQGTSVPVFPTRSITPGMGLPIANGTLTDYLGFPTGTGTPTTQVNSALPYRGYQLIFNEWYRDQDLQTAGTVSTASGVDTTTTVGAQRACWPKDYFTVARPFAQKGPDIAIPMDTYAPVIPHPTVASRNPGIIKDSGTNTPVADGGVTASGGTGLFTRGSPSYVDPNGALGVNTSSAAGSMYEFRLAAALLRYEEARARFGSRYTEYLRYLGVRSSDARLQRPEYLGGGKQVIQFSEVLQTGVTTDGDDTEGVGNLKGHGIAALRSNRYRKFFEEHGYIFTIMSIVPKGMYMTATPRTYLRRTKEDFWQKELQFIGQQEITEKEIFSASANPNDVWGYIDRYDDYRRELSTVSGDFRESLDFWHYARTFGAQPDLNSDFVSCAPTDRVYAVPSEQHFWIMANHSIQARRMVAPTGGESRII